MSFTLDTTTIKTITLAESITHAQVKDCFMWGEMLVFVFEEQDIGKVFARKGSNSRRLEQLLRKRVKLVGFSHDLIQFVKNLVYPLEIEKKEEQEGVLSITGKDTQTRAILIGRNASNLRAIEEIVKRYFPIKEIKVIQ